MLGGHVGTGVRSCSVLALPVGRPLLGTLAVPLELVPCVEAGQSSNEPTFAGSVVAAPAVDVAVLAVATKVLS